ncbi:MAG: toll/interleukin-1 receptor domain-containing protein, partial [Clostridia bacterium]|nr:toll/interleukin-1 receptor domain-containing protein [Clostridia bacterium]
MAVFKCKICGGDLEVQEKATVSECAYCGTKQTVPSLDDEKKLQLFNRANRLRYNNEFDKAAGVYESIVAEFPEEPESYWGLVLCKYGIEYVDDKKTGRKIPTCHRTVPVSILDDKNYELAYEYADNSAKAIYREEAKEIDKIQKSILSIVENENPYDVFICYKETDENGNRTEDSLLAQDIYTELVKEDYKVFFSRVTLRDMAGTEYEPYIYAALKSAKVMLCIGTKYEYFDA